MLIMTGPNYSGKSVYLKQVALIVYLAHIGSFVLADSAHIGITDRILTRISTRESVSRAQSAFMVDLQQISMALQQATSRSLLVLDEFGKGTNNSDGTGLACGVFEYLLDLEGDARPKVLCATHFHEIFENNFLKLRPNLQLAHMEIILNEQAGDEKDRITHLYTLRNGRSTASFGTCCASMSGIAPEIISRANDLIEIMRKGEDLVQACCSLKKEAEDLQTAVSCKVQYTGKPKADRAMTI